MLDPQSQSLLDKYNLVLKKIIYDPGRMSQFLQMMSTVSGAIQAAKSVVGAVDARRPIPPNIKPLLAVNAYLLMVDVAQRALGKQVAPAVLKRVISTLVTDNGHQLVDGSGAAAPPTPAPATGGIIGGAMGAPA